MVNEAMADKVISPYNPYFRGDCSFCANRHDCKYQGICNKLNYYNYFEMDEDAHYDKSGERYNREDDTLPIDSQREWTLRYLKPSSKRVSLDFSCTNITQAQAEEIIARLKVIELCNIGGFYITRQIHQAKIDGILNTSRSIDGFNSVIATQQITKQDITHSQNIREIQEKNRGSLIAGGGFNMFKKKR